MKSLSGKRALARVLIIILLVAATSFAATGAVSQQIQATLSPDITIRLDGEVQIMRDANGNQIHPILYQGSTYLPLRAVANMLGVPVDWDASTRTVFLGGAPAGERSLVAAGTIHRDSHPRWSAIQGAGNLPQDHTFGYRQTGVNSFASRLVLQLNERHTTLSLTWAVTEGQAGNKYRAEVYNADTDVVLSTTDVQMGSTAEVSGVNIAGVERLGFRIVRTDGRDDALGWILSPYVR
jgi:hypothetical protein